MDILISSNLERLLFDLSGENDAEVRGYMDAPGQDRAVRGRPTPIKAALQDQFWGGFCDEAGTSAAIAKLLQGGRLPHRHPHRRGGQACMEQYRQETGDETVTVFVSTASPYKFCDQRAARPSARRRQATAWSCMDQLHAATGVSHPPAAGGR